MNDSGLTVDQLLTTTRCVRRRLDLDRPVPLDLIRACVALALQAPTGGNSQGGHFVVVADPGKRAGLADLYRRAWAGYRKATGSVYDRCAKEPAGPRREQLRRVAESADYLVEHLHRVPVHVIPCIEGRLGHVPLLPTAYFSGASFQPALRRLLADTLHIDGW